jgi:metal-sulfur cluster biosynthetic enzyme
MSEPRPGGGRMSEPRPGSMSESRPGGLSELEAGAMPELEARLWTALTEVEDPEIPVSVVGLGLIVSLNYDGDQRAVEIELTFTAMGCPAMDFIQDDIRERLLREPEVDEVRIEVVWDPVWTRARIREDARARMRSLGIVA